MKLFFQHATVLDGTREMLPRPMTDVLVEDGRIAAVGALTPPPERRTFLPPVKEKCLTGGSFASIIPGIARKNT